MSIQVCIFLCVLVVCITALFVNIIEKYPQWATYYEYKQKANNYDTAKETYNDDIKDVVSQVTELQEYFKKDSHHAYNLLGVILQIKIALKEKSSTKAINSIKNILENNNL